MRFVALKTLEQQDLQNGKSFFSCKIRCQGLHFVGAGGGSVSETGLPYLPLVLSCVVYIDGFIQ